MTKQPLLTHFPSTIFATAKRQAQIRLRHCRQQLTRRSISGYSLLFEDFLHPEFLAGVDPTRRQRNFGHIPVFWAWAGQILEGNASCSRAIGLIQSWCRALKIPAPNGDTGAYCQARKRIQEPFLDAVHEEVCKGLQRGTSGRDLWHGMTLKAIAGSSVTLMDTPENQARYPQHSSSKKGCCFPIMGIVGLVNLSHGGWESIVCCESEKHDARIAPQLLPLITSNDLLLADRAFCSYEFVSRLTTGRGAHILIRLHQSRQRKLDWRRGKN